MNDDLEERTEDGREGLGCIAFSLIGMASIVIIGIAGTFSIYAYNAPKIVEAGKEIRIQAGKTRMQELRTIETLAEKYGDQMSAEEFREYIQNLKLGYKNEPTS